MDEKNTAILVLDHQNLLINNYVKDSNEHLDKVSKFLKSVRQLGISVFFVKVGFRPGFPEVSERNKIFKSVREGGRFLDTDDGSQIPESIISTDSDLVVTKTRVSAFEGTELQLLLRSQGISQIVLFGIITSGVVLSTVRQAADLDYEILILEDFCHDPSPDVQQVLLGKVLPMQATVMTSSECLDLLCEQR